MYFVVECTTRSAPSASGLARAGEAKVLSTATTTPRACASSASGAMSAIAVVGLLIVSSQSSRVRSPIAASTAAASVVSTAWWPMPLAREHRSREADDAPVDGARHDDLVPGAQHATGSTAWMAAMPEEVASAASAPSSSARAASSAAWVGFE